MFLYSSIKTIKELFKKLKYLTIGERSRKFGTWEIFGNLQWRFVGNPNGGRCVLTGNLVDHCTYLFVDIYSIVHLLYSQIYETQIYATHVHIHARRTGCDYVSITKSTSTQLITNNNNNNNNTNNNNNNNINNSNKR